MSDDTDYDDPENIYNFGKNVLCRSEFIDDRLIRGQFCQIASGARFIVNGSNYAMNGFKLHDEWFFYGPV